jgi:hypothetical protein
MPAMIPPTLPSPSLSTWSHAPRTLRLSDLPTFRIHSPDKLTSRPPAAIAIISPPRTLGPQTTQEGAAPGPHACPVDAETLSCHPRGSPHPHPPTDMKRLLPFVLALAACTTPSGNPGPADSAPGATAWEDAPGIDLSEFNRDVVPGRLTLDVGVYYPSNFDPAFDKVTLPRLLEGVRAAKEIFAPTGVQLNLLFVRTGPVDPRFLTIAANEVPPVPRTEYANLYEHGRRHPAQLTADAREAFESIIEPRPDSERTVHLVVLQDVFFPFLEVAEGRNWTVRMVRTGGLSFPTYSYPGTIPARYRGVITISNLSRPDRFRRTVAHEIGHKVMNVSHEYRDVDPEHEVYAEGGLMVYGSGEEIGGGREERWHVERLRVSPFLYRLNQDGSKTWNPDYREGGHYYDPIYGEHVVRFRSRPVIDPNW